MGSCNGRAVLACVITLPWFCVFARKAGSIMCLYFFFFDKVKTNFFRCPNTYDIMVIFAPVILRKLHNRKDDYRVVICEDVDTEF